MAKKQAIETEVTETQETSEALPVFSLSAGNLDFDNEDDLKTELEKSGGKYFDEPGNTDLKVIAADFHKNKVTGSIYCKGDNTWFNVKITLQGADDKQIDHWLQVPTTKLKFGEKGTLAVFKKFQQFLFGIGEEVTLNNLQKVCQKYFAVPSKLIGTTVNVDLGYEGPYVGKAEDGENFVIVVKGEPLKEDGEALLWPDRSSAVNAAKARGIEPSFIRVLKFTPKKAVKAAPAAKAVKSNDGW